MTEWSASPVPGLYLMSRVRSDVWAVRSTGYTLVVTPASRPRAPPARSGGWAVLTASARYRPDIRTPSRDGRGTRRLEPRILSLDFCGTPPVFSPAISTLSRGLGPGWAVGQFLKSVGELSGKVVTGFRFRDFYGVRRPETHSSKDQLERADAGSWQIAG